MPPTQRLAQHAIRTVQLYPDLKFISQPDTSAQAERERTEEEEEEARSGIQFQSEVCSGKKKKSDLICVGHQSHNELYLTTAEFTSV